MLILQEFSIKMVVTQLMLKLKDLQKNILLLGLGWHLEWAAVVGTNSTSTLKF